MEFFYRKTQTLNRILLHILFWLVSLIVFGYMFKISDVIERIDVIYSVLFHLSICLGVYLNLLLLIPLLLNRKKFVLYILLLVFLIIGITFLNQLTFSRFADVLLPDYYFVSQFNYLYTCILVAGYLIVVTFLKLSKSWFKLQEINRHFTNIEKENLNSQLKALKAQINPHFLFNSLNVLYSLTLKQSNETSDAIIKLSDILRYVIYDSNKETVSIKSEVELINNYLNLQKYRIDSSSKINFETNIQDEIQISPMLFLPLVENSFKHGIKGDILNTYVSISIFASNEMVQFEIDNNKGINDSLTGKTEGGIGLTNIRKRLNLLYPDKHQFIIDEDETKFKVLLKIEL